MIINVELSTFWYNIENPELVSYQSNEGWRPIKVGYYIWGVPEPKEGQILYKLDDYHGWILRKKENEEKYEDCSEIIKIKSKIKSKMKIEKIIERSILAELDMPKIWDTDYQNFNDIYIPDDVLLTTEDKSEMIIDTKNGKKMFSVKPIAFNENDFDSISKYLQQNVDKGNQVWIRKIATHKEGRKFTILESVIVNKEILNFGGVST